MYKFEFGKFLSQLRQEKGMTQEQLASLIPIGREAISKWERGINYPDHISLAKLCEIFDISTNELFYGEKENENNKKDIAKVSLNLYEKENKTRKILKFSIILSVLLIIIFLTYYFFNTFNSLKVYGINYSDDDLTIHEGIMVTTKEKVFLNFDVESGEDIKNIKLYYKDNRDNDHLIIETDDTNIELTEYLGYNNFFDFKDLDLILKNTYLEVLFNEKTRVIKIDFYKNFSNDYFIPKKDPEMSNNNEPDVKLKDQELENKILNKFTILDDMYYLQDNDLEFYYNKDMNFINLIQRKKESSKSWNYNTIFKSLLFQEYNDEDMINSFVYKNNEIECMIDNCRKDPEEIKFFLDNLERVLN